MTSQAQRRQRKRNRQGRIPEEGVARYQSGRKKVSIKALEDAAKSVVRNQRVKHFGANETNWDNAEFGSLIGRLYKQGRLGDDPIAKDRLKAAEKYVEDMRMYYATSTVTAPNPQAQNMFSARGHRSYDETESEQVRATKASNQMMHLYSILQQAGREPARAVYNICLEEPEGAEAWPSHMFAWLRKGLDALIEDQS